MLVDHKADLDVYSMWHVCCNRTDDSSVQTEATQIGTLQQKGAAASCRYDPPPSFSSGLWRSPQPFWWWLLCVCVCCISMHCCCRAYGCLAAAFAGRNCLRQAEADAQHPLIRRNLPHKVYPGLRVQRATQCMFHPLLDSCQADQCHVWEACACSTMCNVRGVHCIHVRTSIVLVAS